MKRARSKLKRSAQSRLPKETKPAKVPFIEHVYELRKRLFYVAVSVGLFSVAAYFVQQQIVAFLLAPAHNQKFIYTTPGGGLDFLFRVCIYTGIAFSVPVIVHQILKYLEPLIKRDAAHFIRIGSIASGVLALAGMAFGYFLGLPAALHFLLHQFTSSQIQALLSIQSYMSFVTVYMLASAMLFQMPLILLFINRIKPLKPKTLLKHERWVIVVAVVMGGIINPSPNIADQMLLAGPMILTYHVGVLMVWLINRRKRKPAHVLELLKKDAEAQAARLARFEQARAQWQGLLASNFATRQVSTVAAAPAVSAAGAEPAASITEPAPRPQTHPRRNLDISPRRIY